MFRLLSDENLLLYVQLAAIAGVLIRFVTSGLYRTYRFFFTYLLVFAVQAFYPLTMNRDSDYYAYIFLATEGVIILLYALIVLELYSLVLRELPGIASISRRYIKIALAAAILVALLVLQFEQTPQNAISRFFSFESTIVCSLVFFVLLITLFLVVYPIPLSRNVIFYSIGYAFYFSTKAVALFLRNTGHQGDKFGLSLLAGATACLFFWIFSLSKAGEKKTIVVGHKWSNKDEKRLIEQLDAINEILMRK